MYLLVAFCSLHVRLRAICYFNILALRKAVVESVYFMGANFHGWLKFYRFAVAIFRLYLPPLGEKPCIKIKKTVQIFKVKSLDFSLTKQFLAFYRKDWGREQRLPDTLIFYMYISDKLYLLREKVLGMLCA